MNRGRETVREWLALAPIRAWWCLKTAVLPHLDRRAMRRPTRMKAADDMLATAMINMTRVMDAIEPPGKKKK